MIKSLTITNPKGETLKLELANPDPSGLIVQKIEGLGPPKANINTTELATLDGSLFASSRATNRNIVINLAFLFAPTIEDARQKTYKFFPIKKPIAIEIETDNRQATITGYVESNTPDIFSQAEATQISLVCPDPYFYEVGGSEKVYTKVQPNFEFPFSNESLTQNLLEFGIITEDPRAILNYIGDVDTGTLITIHALTAPGDITLYNVDTRRSFKIFDDRIKTITGASFGAGDDILISTIKGEKYVRLLRDGVETNIISAIDLSSDWFQLSNGINTFSFVTKEKEANIAVTFTYKNAFGGI